MSISNKSFHYVGLILIVLTVLVLVPSLVTATNPEYKLGDRTLSLGSWGADVFELQLALIKIGYEIKADGLFGRETQSAVMAHQIANGLKPDGIVGPETILIMKANTKTIEYIVQPGDSLWVLAKKFDTTMDEIFSLNNLKSSLLRMGQKLLIPSPPTYVVVPGDTLSVIAQRFQCSVEELMVLNEITNPHLIREGQELRLPRTSR